MSKENYINKGIIIKEKFEERFFNEFQFFGYEYK